MRSWMPALAINAALLLLVGVAAATGRAPDSGQARGAGNAELRSMIAAGHVTGLDEGPSLSLDAWATSSLVPSEAGSTVRFGPLALRDGRSSTAWCEGVAGDGVGEIVIGPPLVEERPVEIWIGYGKSPALFRSNGRPRRVRVHLLGG
jgi:hypothetical protein